MKKFSALLIALVSNILIVQAAFSESIGSFHTHCKSGEYTYLDAKMANYELDSNGALLNRKNGKILSLCADKPKEPFGKFVYRYGAIGKIEMEKVATSSDKFSIYSRQTYPQTGENIFFFSVGNFKYYVTEGVGMGSGISLMVFKSGKKILNLFSGSNYGSDFEYRFNRLNELPITIDFEKALSPIFMVEEPADILTLQ